MLVVPDGTRTFDAPRPGTSYAHLRTEFHKNTTVVDDQHIREFCTAVFSQPSIHPPKVRDWYDPDRLDAARFDLHRRRSIHAHCWTPEEFGSLLVASIADGCLAWKLQDLYVPEDFPEQSGIEFGLALERRSQLANPMIGSESFVRAWTELVLGGERRDPERIARFVAALSRDLPKVGPLGDLAIRPVEILGWHLAATRKPTSVNGRSGRITER